MTIPTPSYQSSKQVRYDVLRSPIGGTVLRRSRNGNKRTVYTLVYNAGQLDQTKAAQLIAEYDAAKGGASETTFTPHHEVSAIDVQFAENELTMNVASLVAFGCTIQLVKEVI